MIKSLIFYLNNSLKARNMFSKTINRLRRQSMAAVVDKHNRSDDDDESDDEYINKIH